MSARKPQRGGWSGGPVPRDNNLLIATVALAEVPVKPKGNKKAPKKGGRK